MGARGGAAVEGFYSAVAADPVLAELYLVHSDASRVECGRLAATVRVERLTPLSASAEEFFARAIVWPAARRVRGPEVAELPGEAQAWRRWW